MNFYYLSKISFAMAKLISITVFPDDKKSASIWNNKKPIVVQVIKLGDFDRIMKNNIDDCKTAEIWSTSAKVDYYTAKHFLSKAGLFEIPNLSAELRKKLEEIQKKGTPENNQLIMFDKPVPEIIAAMTSAIDFFGSVTTSWLKIMPTLKTTEKPVEKPKKKSNRNIESNLSPKAKEFVMGENPDINF